MVQLKRRPRPVTEPGRVIPKDIISRQVVETILDLRWKKDTLDSQLENLTRELQQLESHVIDQLERDCLLEPGTPACVVEVDRRRNPRYKTELLKRLGKEVLHEIIKSTPYSLVKKLVISATKRSP